MQGKFWTISNVLSLSRIILMAPVVYFFLTPVIHNREYAVLFLLLAITTDALDGYFARLLKQESEIGKIIDPLADKICVGIVVVLLLFFGDISVWFAVIVILRDALIFIGGLILKVRKGIILASNLAGKFAVAFVAFTLVFAMMRYHFFSLLMPFSLFVSVVLLLFSFAVYIKKFYTVMKSSPDINNSSRKGNSQ
jgi:CDP-diacylglycerol--glycerol-3-phosphate 3-phosphatidyltransferase